MPQIIIDPRNIPARCDSVSITPIPPKARSFGFVPDLRRCEAGDLILSHSILPGFTERLIVRAQIQAGFSPDDSRWTHAAVFLYQDFVLEAVPWKGVITRSLYSDIPENILKVRRRPNLGDEEEQEHRIKAYKIALCAQRMLGTRYGVSAALSLGWRSTFRGGLWNRDWLPLFRSAVICSQVVYDAHAEITRDLLDGCPVNGGVMPAHLSATSDLEDVSIPWVKVG